MMKVFLWVTITVTVAGLCFALWVIWSFGRL